MTISLRTERLELIAATREIFLADLNDRNELGHLLHAEIPVAWPPPLMDENVKREFIRMSETGNPQFSVWYWVRDEPGTVRKLIGNGGILPSDIASDTVVLGYSVLDGFQNRGYATEAVRHLIPIFFSLHGIRKVIATTYPESASSLRVLEKNGFVRTGLAHAGTGAEEGTIGYILRKQ